MTETNVRLFTPADYPAIVNIHNSLSIVWPEAPRTPAGWAQADQRRNPRYPFRRWVAETGGQVVGFGAFWQYSLDFHPPWFYVNVEVSPSHQRQGIGAALGAAGSATAVAVLICFWPFAFRQS